MFVTNKNKLSYQEVKNKNFHFLKNKKAPINWSFIHVVQYIEQNIAIGNYNIECVARAGFEPTTFASVY